MRRGPKPLAAIGDAKKFAEKMGYFWEENTNPALPYDIFIFKKQNMSAVKVRVTRYSINPDDFYENLLPEEVAGMQSLPFPAIVLREIWLRTQHERTFRRLTVHEFGVGEIGFLLKDGYVNPHAKD